MKLRSSSNIPCLQRIFSRQICLYRELTERSSLVNKIIVNLEAFASHGCISGRFVAGPVYLGTCLSRGLFISKRAVTSTRTWGQRIFSSIEFDPAHSFEWGRGEKSAAEIASTRLNCAGSALTRRTDQPSHSDANGVECKHRSSEQTHVQDVAGRCDNRRKNKNCEYRVPQIPPHPARRNHPHQRKKEHQNWHFENQAETDDDGCKQLGIFSNRNHRLEALSVTD